MEAKDDTCFRLGLIYSIEAAKYSPSLELVFKITDAFGVGLEEEFQYQK